MAIRRGDGPLTTDDGWWQKADGSWHPPETHPLRHTAGFVEDLPEPPPAELLAQHDQTEVEAEAEPEPAAPTPVSVAEAPVESPAVQHGPSPAERLNNALDDSEKIVLPEARPRRPRSNEDVVFKSETVEIGVNGSRRSKNKLAPAAAPVANADDGTVSFRSQVVEVAPDKRRRGRRKGR